MYLEIFLGNFTGFCVFWGISRDFAEIPEFRGSATARNIRSPVLITRAIYQLLSFNKYNKACLNTNLAKTPNLFTVEFQKLLRISVRETCRFMFTRIFYLHLHSYSSLVKTWFSTHRQDFSAVSLPQPTLSIVKCSWLEDTVFTFPFKV